MRLLMLASMYVLGSSCLAQTLSAQEQIASAVLAAGEEQRANATVLGYDANNKLVTLRQGSNELICLADNPNQKGFSVACYHKDLEPLMARGRQLRAEGKSRADIEKIRAEEAASGKLKMPKSAVALHVLSGNNAYYDAAKNQVVNASLRYVVYVPYATQASTGLPTKPVVAGGPWLMFPGTYRAHIMISTGK